jgi:mRNA interferase RelE/StbE
MTRARVLRLPPEVASLLRGLHPELKRRVRAGLDRLEADPAAGKALRGEPAGLRCLRLGRIRVVYRETAGAFDIVAVGPRERIYEETLRLIRR